MSYTRFSRYYDRLMGDFDYDGYIGYLSPYMGGKGLDLACGTGVVTVALARKGMTMQGVDASADMLNVAIQRARNAGVRVDFRRQDMRRFAYASTYRLITAVCDGVNYLRPADLPAFFARVGQALSPDGHFVFDVSTPYKLRNVLGNNLFFEDRDDLVYYWQNRVYPSRHSVSLSLTFFEKQGDAYCRFDEKQTQYWHTTRAIVAAAAMADMQLAAMVDGDTFGAVRPRSRRIIYTFVPQPHGTV